MPSRPDRWSQYDEPEYRTGGMKRVGYDADTQRYYFQEGSELYEGEPGAEFGGQLRHVGRAPRRTDNYPPAAAASHQDRLAWRQLAPFLTLVFVILLLLIRYFWVSFDLVPSTPEANHPSCQHGLVTYKVVKGDNCWSIADARGWNLEKLHHENVGLECEPLRVGTYLCVPPLSS
ncbi:hypothetical protein FRB91_010967 [Serendipita sp. 411]|nr:hypothetical protein FRC16_009713 [Serendipita sp. 398]KAG8832690.1 hypothetical protein FRC18_004667 [Serendipita sp. 400]KAG8857729.1 hypothetical protein FRB91_010967 [Serendipita sp. 411]KAG8865974.1 hypothetical protein FRC20_009210 [Serendipita sp. 405]